MAKSYQQIQAQLAALQKEADAAKKRELQKVVREIKDAIALYGLTADDLGLAGTIADAKRSNRKSAVKGAEPAKAKVVTARKSRSSKKVVASANKAPTKKKSPKAATSSGFADGSGNTWSGRGPRPQWFKDAVAQGKTPDDLRAK